MAPPQYRCSPPPSLPQPIHRYGACRGIARRNLRRWRDRSSAVRREIWNGPRSSFQRPLPYLYLARQVFPDAETPYQALDSLPLAAEPFAAALDLVSVVREYPKRHAERSSSCFDVRTGHLVRRVRHSPRRTSLPRTDCFGT